ncbi:MAG: 6-bladed beta-propeller [Candidatus Aminicenantes bacterium]
MSRKSYAFVLLFLTVSLFSILFSTEKEISRIGLEEILSIGSLEDDILFQWAGVVVDPRGNIYVTDAMDYSLKKFDPQGNLLHKTGRRGQGPGEFMAPRLLDCWGGFIYVTDQHIPGIQVFDTDLNFKRRITIRRPISDFRVLSESQIAVSTLHMKKAASILVFNSKGKLVRSIRYTQEKMPLMMSMVSFEFDKQGHMYIAFTFQDRIEKYDQGGKKVWSESLLNVRKTKKVKVSSYLVPDKIVYKDIALDIFENVFVLGGHFSKNESSDVYVVSPEGRYLTVFTLPHRSHCLYIDSRNFLYSRANDGVTLKKYKMHYSYQ